MFYNAFMVLLCSFFAVWQPLVPIHFHCIEIAAWAFLKKSCILFNKRNVEMWVNYGITGWELHSESICCFTTWLIKNFLLIKYCLWSLKNKRISPHTFSVATTEGFWFVLAIYCKLILPFECEPQTVSQGFGWWVCIVLVNQIQ